MKTTIIYKIDGGDEQEYINISPFDLDGVLYLFFNNRNRRKGITTEFRWRETATTKLK